MGRKQLKKDGKLEKLNGIAGNYIRMVLYAYLLLQIVVFPFYAPQGYVEIGISKYNFFKVSGILCMVIVFPAIVVYLPCVLLKYKKQKQRISFTLTDKAVLFYGLAVLLSFACTAWKEEAVWGAEGWYMGLFSQLMFLVIYFLVSRFTENIKAWYQLLLAVSFVVFLHGILNCFSVYPVRMEGSIPGFISTLGNINWFCSYWMVVFPIGLVLYWIGEEEAVWKKAALIVYVITGFATGVVQGSSSAFLALGAMFLTLLLLSFESSGKLLRWIELGIYFSVSLLLLGAIQGVFPRALNYENAIEKWLTNYRVAFCIFSFMIILYAAAHYLFQKKELQIERICFIQKAIVVLLFSAVVVIAVLTVYYNFFNHADTDSKIAQAFVIDEAWGNGRGTTWRTGVEAFAAMPVWNKLVGVGPDCFYLYAYVQPDIAARLYSVFGNARLTNAHNEWLTVLVDTGILGMISYAAIFLTAIYGQIKKGKEKNILLVCAVCMISYTVHNMISFQQVICTPIMFILIGLGENLYKKH